MTTSSVRHFVTGLFGVLFMLSPLAASATVEQEWRFRVFLDDREIGRHYFTLTQTENNERLATQANFNVTFLKIPFFKYRHDNVEYWNNNCLARIDSSTDQNGKQFVVEGVATEDGFLVNTNSGEQKLPACISTFAYWDKSFLNENRLLNSQTGEYLNVEVNYLGENTFTVGETTVPAHHYRLTADKLDIEVWYSQDDRWLALQSTTEGGRRLRYIAE
ncbi:MAG: DUF6134 family protein [Gammaproteobacteria bacterium]